MSAFLPINPDDLPAILSGGKRSDAEIKAKYERIRQLRKERDPHIVEFVSTALQIPDEAVSSGDWYVMIDRRIIERKLGYDNTE